MMKKFTKTWRKLPIQEKTKILIEHYNISEKDITRIRKISDNQKRLIEAARLQFESFGNIHSDITAWIAGYKSESVIRQKFESALELREKFMHFSNTYKEITPSWQDIRNLTKLPNEMSEELAEEVGIHIGDGNLHASTGKDSFTSYRYRIDGNLIDETLYHEQFIRPLMRRLYNYEGFKVINERKNSSQLNFKSKMIFFYKTKILGLPIGSKINICIPDIIFKNDDFAKRCIVGILDTDFNLNRSMCFNGGLISIKVIKQIDEILDRLNIDHSHNIKGKLGEIYIKKEGSLKILEEWKTHNLKHISKYLVWKEFKTFIYFTHTEERLALLAGKLDREKLELISKNRRFVKNKYAPGQRLSD